MGAANEGKELIYESVEKAEELENKRKNLENNILQYQINKRQKIDSINPKGNIINNKDSNKKFNLKILIYSNENIDENLVNSIQNDNKEIFNWEIQIILGFSKDNSQKIIDICHNDFKQKNFKNVIILPIKSISYLSFKIQNNENDFFASFNELAEEEQPFF